MSPPEEIVLIDCPSRGPVPKSFSPNVWKARAALNFKNIPYTTEWLPYTSLHSTATTSWNVPPNGPGESWFPYTYPCIRLPSGEHVMESLRIAKYLESVQAEPSLRLESDHVKRALDVVTQLQFALIPGVVYRVASVLREGDSEFLLSERAKQFGKHPLELAKMPEMDIKQEGPWKKAEEAIRTLREFLSEDESGPFVEGKQVGFADFVVVGGMKMFEIIDEEGDLYGRLCKEVGGGLVEREVDACKEWFKRDD